MAIHTNRYRGGVSARDLVSLWCVVCAIAVLTATGLSNARWVSAQAPDAGDEFIIPPDTDVGLPIIGPPGEGEGLLEEVVVEVLIIKPLYDPYGEPPVDKDKYPRLCALKKPPANDQGTTVVADAYPYGGAFYWDPPISQEEHSDTAWYECDSTSEESYKKTTSVAYDWEEWGGNADSGYIYVFDADLRFEGLPDSSQDTSEDSPGLYLARGSGRKHLGLKFVPLDPDDVMQSGFHDGQPHSAPPPYQVSLGKGTGVQLYAAQEGGDPVTDLDWGWSGTRGSRNSWSRARRRNFGWSRCPRAEGI
jgi:hypothetical protein